MMKRSHRTLSASRSDFSDTPSDGMGGGSDDATFAGTVPDGTVLSLSAAASYCLLSSEPLLLPADKSLQLLSPSAVDALRLLSASLPSSSGSYSQFPRTYTDIAPALLPVLRDRFTLNEKLLMQTIERCQQRYERACRYFQEQKSKLEAQNEQLARRLQQVALASHNEPTSVAKLTPSLPGAPPHEHAPDKPWSVLASSPFTTSFRLDSAALSSSHVSFASVEDLRTAYDTVLFELVDRIHLSHFETTVCAAVQACFRQKVAFLRRQQKALSAALVDLRKHLRLLSRTQVAIIPEHHHVFRVIEDCLKAAAAAESEPSGETDPSPALPPANALATHPAPLPSETAKSDFEELNQYLFEFKKAVFEERQQSAMVYEEMSRQRVISADLQHKLKLLQADYRRVQQQLVASERRAEKLRSGEGSVPPSSTRSLSSADTEATLSTSLTNLYDASSAEAIRNSFDGAAAIHGSRRGSDGSLRAAAPESDPAAAVDARDAEIVRLQSTNRELLQKVQLLEQQASASAPQNQAQTLAPAQHASASCQTGLTSEMVDYLVAKVNQTYAQEDAQKLKKPATLAFAPVSNFSAVARPPALGMTPLARFSLDAPPGLSMLQQPALSLLSSAGNAPTLSMTAVSANSFVSLAPQAAADTPLSLVRSSPVSFIAARQPQPVLAFSAPQDLSISPSPAHSVMEMQCSTLISYSPPTPKAAQLGLVLSRPVSHVAPNESMPPSREQPRESEFAELRANHAVLDASLKQALDALAQERALAHTLREQVRQERASAQGTTAALRGLEADVSRLNTQADEAAKLKASLDGLQATLAQENARAEQERRLLTAELEAARGQLRVQQQQRQPQLAKSHPLEQKPALSLVCSRPLSHASACFDDQERMLQEKQTEVQALSRTVEALHRQLDDVSVAKREADAHIASLQQQVRQLLDDQIASLNEPLEMKTAEPVPVLAAQEEQSNRLLSPTTTSPPDSAAHSPPLLITTKPASVIEKQPEPMFLAAAAVSARLSLCALPVLDLSLPQPVRDESASERSSPTASILRLRLEELEDEHASLKQALLECQSLSAELERRSARVQHLEERNALLEAQTRATAARLAESQQPLAQTHRLAMVSSTPLAFVSSEQQIVSSNCSAKMVDESADLSRLSLAVEAATRLRQEAVQLRQEVARVHREREAALLQHGLLEQEAVSLRREVASLQSALRETSDRLAASIDENASLAQQLQVTADQTLASSPPAALSLLPPKPVNFTTVNAQLSLSLQRPFSLIPLMASAPKSGALAVTPRQEIVIGNVLSFPSQLADVIPPSLPSGAFSAAPPFAVPVLPAPKDNQPPKPDVKLDTIAALEKTLLSTSHSAQSLLATNQGNERALAELRAQLGAVVGARDALLTQVAQQSGTLDQLRAQLMSQSQLLERVLAQKQAQDEHIQRLEIGRAQLEDSLREVNAQLQLLRQREAQQHQHQQHQQQKTERNDRQDDAPVSTKSLSAARPDASLLEIHALKSTVAQLEQRLQAETSKRADLEASARHSRQRAEQLQSDLTELRTRELTLGSQLHEARLKLEMLTLDHANQSARLEQLQSEGVSKQAWVDQLRARTAQLTEASQQEVLSRQQAVEQLQRSQASHASEVSALQSQLASKERAIDQLRAEQQRLQHQQALDSSPAPVLAASSAPAWQQHQGAVLQQQIQHLQQQLESQRQLFQQQQRQHRQELERHAQESRKHQADAASKAQLANELSSRLSLSQQTHAQELDARTKASEHLVHKLAETDAALQAAARESSAAFSSVTAQLSAALGQVRGAEERLRLVVSHLTLLDRSLQSVAAAFGVPAQSPPASALPLAWASAPESADASCAQWTHWAVEALDSVAREKVSLDDAHRRLQDKLEQLESAASISVRRLELKQIELSALEKQLGEEQAAAAAMRVSHQQKLDESGGRIRGLELRNAQLSHTVQALEAAQHPLKQELAGSLEAVARLGARADGLQDERDKLASLCKELESCATDIQDALAGERTTRAQLESVLHMLEAGLESERRDRQRAVEAAQSEAAKTRKEYEALSSGLFQCFEEQEALVSSLERDLQVLRTQSASEAAAQLAEMTAALEKAQRKLAEQQELCSVLTRDRDEWRADCERSRTEWLVVPPSQCTNCQRLAEQVEQVLLARRMESEESQENGGRVVVDASPPPRLPQPPSLAGPTLAPLLPQPVSSTVSASVSRSKTLLEQVQRDLERHRMRFAAYETRLNQKVN